MESTAPPAATQATPLDRKQFDEAVAVAQSLCKGLAKVILGRNDTIKLTVAALLADGHVLLEDYPGSGKTTLAKTLGKLISKDSSQANGASDHILSFRRVQFTPDMLPGDVLGVNIFEPKLGNFRFLHGPVFAHIVLADEINRTGPKVQAAFLECMAEKQVTIDNVTYPLDDLFFVLGTQNPLDIAGTYPLPLVQLDRFLLKIPMPYVDARTEDQILQDHSHIQKAVGSMQAVCTRSQILKARTVAERVHLNPALREAIVGIVQATRNSPAIQFGASTRAALMLQAATKAWALVEGREFATVDDLKYIAPAVLLHRLKFHGGAGKPAEQLQKLMLPFIEKLAQRSLRGS
jgi:MoxR-like ATPase